MAATIVSTVNEKKMSKNPPKNNKGIVNEVKGTRKEAG